jgi:hypothetical protein
MKFHSTVPGTPLAGALEYVLAEHSFAFRPRDALQLSDRAGSDGRTSVLVGTVQIEVAVDSQSLLYAWGYCPRANWSRGALVVPTFVDAEVHISTDSPLIAGVSLRATTATEQMGILYDTDSGWICIGTTDCGSAEMVLIATGVGIGLADSSLASIWLRPAFV